MSTRILSTLLVGVSGLAACQPRANGTDAASSEPRAVPEWSTVLDGNGTQLALAGSAHEDRLVVAGTFDRELASGDRLIEGDGSVDAFITLFDSDSTKWLRTIQGPGDEVVQDVVAWDNGVVAVGLVSDGATLLDAVATVEDGTRPLLTELSKTGKLRSFAHFEGSGYSAFTKVARGSEGALYVGGEVAGRLELGAKTIEGNGEAFVAQLDNNGAPTWVLPLSSRPEADDSSGSVRVSDVKVAADGSLYAAGLFSGGMAVGTQVLTGSDDLATTPYLLHLSADGELLFASTAVGAALVEEGHESHAGHAHSEHGAFELSSPAIVPLADDHALVSVAYGIPFAGHGDDFEAPALANLSLIETDNRGEVARIDSLHAAGIIPSKVALIGGGEAPIRAIASWVGTLEVDETSFVSEQGRSTLFFDWSRERGISNPHAFRISGLSVTSDSACGSEQNIWSIGHQVDPASGERDAIVVRFPKEL